MSVISMSLTHTELKLLTNTQHNTLFQCVCKNKHNHTTETVSQTICDLKSVGRLNEMNLYISKQEFMNPHLMTHSTLLHTTVILQHHHINMTDSIRFCLALFV